MLRLRELRQARFYSQRQLAELAGVAETTIIRIEQGGGVPNPSTVRKLAAALGVAPAALVPDISAYNAARQRQRRASARQAAQNTQNTQNAPARPDEQP